MPGSAPSHDGRLPGSHILEDILASWHFEWIHVMVVSVVGLSCIYPLWFIVCPSQWVGLCVSPFLHCLHSLSSVVTPIPLSLEEPAWQEELCAANLVIAAKLFKFLEKHRTAGNYRRHRLTWTPKAVLVLKCKCKPNLSLITSLFFWSLAGEKCVFPLSFVSCLYVFCVCLSLCNFFGSPGG